MATFQPSFTLPSTFSTGTRTLEKNISLKPESPDIILSGRTVMPGDLHVDQQAGDALVLGRRRIGAHDQQAQVGDVGVAGPDLLAVDDEVVAVAHALGFERGQVAAGVRLGEALAPDFVAREDAGQVAFLLLFGADGDDRRPDQSLADRAHPLRGVGQGQLFLEDGLLDERGAAAAEFLGPGDAGIAAFEQLALPGLEILVVLGGRRRPS